MFRAAVTPQTLTQMPMRQLILLRPFPHPPRQGQRRQRPTERQRPLQLRRQARWPGLDPIVRGATYRAESKTC